MVSRLSQIETFSLWLPDADSLLGKASGSLRALDELEQTVADLLPACERLVRWAIIRIENNQALVEGAYLTTV